MIARRTFVSGAVAAAAALTAPRPAAAQSAQPMVNLNMTTAPVDVGADAFYAQSAGFFAKHGINAQLLTGINGPSAAAGVLGGSINLGASDLSVIVTAHDKGLPFVLVAPEGMYRSSDPTAGFLVLKDSPIKTPHDLVGKTIGVTGLHSLSMCEIFNWMTAAGLKRTDINFVEIPFVSMDAALVSKRVDALGAEEPLITTTADHTRVLARPADAVGKQFLEAGFFTSREFAARNRDAIRRFADAMAETHAWANTHHDETFAVLNKIWKGRLPANLPRCAFPERLRSSDIQPLIKAAYVAGYISKEFPASELFAPGVGAV